VLYSDPSSLIYKMLIVLSYLARKVRIPLPWMALLEDSIETTQ